MTYENDNNLMLGEFNMEIISKVFRKESSDCVVYYIEDLSDEFKKEIRNNLVLICHGEQAAETKRAIYSYKATVKEFIQRYSKKDKDSLNRKKGMIGELLVHVLLEMDKRFITVSPFFNMEERSFKKGYDIILQEIDTKDLWITEVKSGAKQKKHNNSNSAIKALISTAKRDLETRLNEENHSLWLNAINGAKTSMSNNNNQKGAIVELLERIADDFYYQTISSKDMNVILAGTLFHNLDDRMEIEEIDKKQKKVVQEKLFHKVYVLAIQKGTFEKVFEFLSSEVEA